MPVANYNQYCEMLNKAKEKKYAFPAFNVTSMTTINAVLTGLENKKSDGIIQISTGGGEFASGQKVKDMSLGAISLASYIHQVAHKYNICVAIHTDHCHYEKLDSFLYPLIKDAQTRKKNKEKILFNSHMFDGSTLALKENLKISKKILEELKELDMILEIEAGVVGGEEDGVKADKDAKLYTTTEDMLQVAEEMGMGENGRYMFAATFGNVHGVYKPGSVKLKPSILKDGQVAIEKKYGRSNMFDLVFHGGSGSSLEEIRETLNYGVIKMNIDTDTQYAFSREIVHHIMSHYDKVLKIDKEVGNKKYYDPRSYLKLGEIGMSKRVEKACEDLRSENETIMM